MNTDKITTQAPVSGTEPAKDVSNYQLLLKLLELEKKMERIEKKLTTPLIS